LIARRDRGITKPLGLEEFAKVVDSIEDFWFTIVRLPKRG